MKDKDQNDINRENEKMKKRIDEEFGGKMGTNPDLPPDIENQFLKNVLAFEEQFNTGGETTVYMRIGEPEWASVDELDDQGIQKELQNLSDLMLENGISLDCICKVDDRELYRFITEELFQHEIMDISVPGMMTCFIYEEFHPNHAYDSERAGTEFITDVLLKNADTEDWYFNENLKISLSPEIERENAIQKVKHFVNSWTETSIDVLEITSVKVTDDQQTALIDFKIAYSARVEGSSETIFYKGKGHITLRNVFERLGCAGWDVLTFKMPGFDLE